MRSEQTNPDLLQQMAYEPKDVNIKQVLMGVVALLIFFVICMGVIAFLYNIFIPDWGKLGRQEPLPVGRRMPPQPQVQTNPKRDFELYRQAEDKTISGQGTAMSVEQAIDAMATQKGISGLRGDALHQQGSGYPGQTSAVGATAESENKTTPAATTAGEVEHAATEHGGNR